MLLEAGADTAATTNAWVTRASLAAARDDMVGLFQRVARQREETRLSRHVALAMGHHPRLGEGSQVLALEEGVVRMVLDLV